MGGLDRRQPRQRVPPPGLAGAGDALRVEQPHRAARSGAQLRGRGPQVGLVAGGHDGARRGQDVRDAQRGRLAGPGCHERGEGVFPGGKQGRPAACRPLEVAEQQPGLARGKRTGIGSGQRPAEPDRRFRGRDRRQRPDLRGGRQRGHRISRTRDPCGDDSPRQSPGRDGGTSQRDADQQDQEGGGAGPGVVRAPPGQADDPVLAERGHVAACQGGGDPGREPGHQGAGRKAPADHQDDPDPGAVGRHDRHPRACRPAHGRFSAVRGSAGLDMIRLLDGGRGWPDPLQERPGVRDIGRGAAQAGGAAGICPAGPPRWPGSPQAPRTGLPRGAGRPPRRCQPAAACLDGWPGLHRTGEVDAGLPCGAAHGSA